MIKMVKVIELRPLDGYRVWFRFSDGAEGIRDFADLIAKGGQMVEPLRDKTLFDRVFISFGVPSWPNGFDVDAINLHMVMEASGALRKPVAAE